MGIQEITEFKNEFDFLSNFYPAPTLYKGIIYPTSEHAFVASKSNDPSFKLEVLNTSSPGRVKRLGRNCELVCNWDDIKDTVMLEVVRNKFLNNPELYLKLMVTENAYIYEGNTWGDRYWGVSPPGTANGKNKLGEILMKVRKELKVLFTQPN